MKRALISTFLLGLLLASMGSRADYEPWLKGPAMAKMKKDCAEDVQKLCRVQVAQPKPIEPNHPPRGCLRENLDKLSSGCKVHFDAIEARRPRANPAVKEKTSDTPVLEPQSENSPSTSLEMESSDLAAALASVRAIPVGEPLSPAERTITLAWVATSSQARNSEPEETKPSNRGKSASVPSTSDVGTSTESL